MAQTQAPAYRNSQGENIDYTPSAATYAGDVVFQGSLCGIATQDIAASTLGSLAVFGVFAVPKVTGAITAGAAVYWNAVGDPVTGTAGTGAANVTGIGNTMGIAALAAASGDSFVNVRLLTVGKTQVTPIALTATGTLTAAQLTTGLITVTSASAVASTVPTGTLIDTARPGGAIDDYFDWTIVNLGSSSGACTVTAGTGHTLVGNMVVAITTSATFRSRRTAANTWVTYRLNG